MKKAPINSIDYRAQLETGHSREITDRIAASVGDNPGEFAKIVDLIYNAPAPVPQRASWVLAVISRRHPGLVRPYLSKFIDTVKAFPVGGIRRNMMLAIAAQKDVPVKSRSKLIDICFEMMLSKDEPVAVKVWAMESASNLCRMHPGLGNELREVIADQIPRNSVAFSARAKQVLKRL